MTVEDILESDWFRPLPGMLLAPVDARDWGYLLPVRVHYVDAMRFYGFESPPVSELVAQPRWVAREWVCDWSPCMDDRATALLIEAMKAARPVDLVVAPSPDR